jgi:hypothetical protein
MSVRYRRYGVRRHTDRPSVTELPGLTSDPIYTADRRGGILIHFGPMCTPTGHISPSEFIGPNGRSMSARPGHVCITSECPVPLKGIVSDFPGNRNPGSSSVFTVEPSTALKGTDAERRPAGSTPPRRVRISTDGGDALKPVEPRAHRDEIP